MADDGRSVVDRKVASQTGGALDTVDHERRRALKRLGLAVGVAYAAPAILHLDREAKAMMVSTPCPTPDGNCANNPVSCTC